MARTKLKGKTVEQIGNEFKGTLVGKLDLRAGGPLVRAHIWSDEEFLGLTREDVMHRIRGFLSKQLALEEINRVRLEHGVDPI